MTLNRLKTYKWEQGSQNNPVTLTSDEFGWLIDLIKTERINKDIRGWIRPTRDVTSYEKYLVELAKDSSGQPLLHLVDVNISAIEYNVTPSSNKVNEGDRVKINVNNIALDALKFRIVNHTVQTEEYQNRTSIDTELGYVVVEPARENATWNDVVTIQTCPVWEDWDGVNSSIRTFDITVNAQQVTDVTITAPDVVGPSQTFYPTVNFVPSGHTKPIVHTLEEAAQKKGICFIPRSDDFTVSKRDSKTIVAVAPVTETELDSYYSISCDVYAFTDQSTIATPSVDIACKHPYIQLTVTTDGTFSDISGANGGNGPKVTLKKLDSNGSVLEDNLQLTKTVGEDRIVYTYGGGNVKADGKETYVASFGDVNKYNYVDDVTIVPTGVINNVDIVYVLKKPAVYLANEDGSKFDKLEDAVERGRTTLVPKYIVIYEDGLGDIYGERCICVELNAPYISTENDNMKWQVFSEPYNTTDTHNWLKTNVNLLNYVKYSYPLASLAINDYNGFRNTQDLISAFEQIATYTQEQLGMQDPWKGPLFNILAYLDTTFMGVPAKGYIQTVGEAYLYRDGYNYFIDKIRSIGLDTNITFAVGQTQDSPDHVATSNVYNSDQIWVSTGGNETTPGSVPWYSVRPNATGWFSLNILPMIHIDIDEFKARVGIGKPKLKVTISSNEEDADKLATIKSQVITITDKDGNAIDLTDGQSIEVLGDGSEEYTISAPSIHGYKISGTGRVVPNSMLTKIEIVYSIIVPDIYVVYDDGFEESYQTIVDRNYVLDKERRDVGIAVVTYDSSFILPWYYALDGGSNFKFNSDTAELVIIPNCYLAYSPELSVYDYDGYENTQAILDYYSNREDIPAVAACANQKMSIAKEERTGYLPAVGELITLYNNIEKVNMILKNSKNLTTVGFSGTTWSATQASANNMYCFSNNSQVLSYKKTYGARTICFFKY